MKLLRLLDNAIVILVKIWRELALDSKTRRSILISRPKFVVSVTVLMLISLQGEFHLPDVNGNGVSFIDSGNLACLPLDKRRIRLVRVMDFTLLRFELVLSLIYD